MQPDSTNGIVREFLRNFGYHVKPIDVDHTSVLP